MPDYLEGHLDLTRSALLDAHLDVCADCSRDFAEMRATVSLLRDLPDPEPPPLMVEQILRRIRDGEARRTVGDRVRGFIESLATPQIALPATALVLGLLMATDTFDPATISFRGLFTGAGDDPVVQQAPSQIRVVRRDSWPELAPGWPPPAVAGAPRVRITLPASRARADGRQLAGLGDPFGRSVSVQRAPTRWSPRSVRNPIGSALSLSVATGSSSVATGSSVASAFRVVPGTASLSSIDQRLEHLIRQPVLFAAEHSTRPILEQEEWVQALAERARELGRSREALAALRSVPDLRARELAGAFAGELGRQARPSVASLGSEGRRPGGR
jgi:hypothetical protein